MAFAFHSLHSSSSSSLSTSSSRAGTRQYSSSSSSSIDRLRRRNLALSLVLVTPSGPISLPLPLQYPEIYDNLCLDSEDDDIYRGSNESLNSLPSSRPTTPSTLPTSNSVDTPSDSSMAYYTVSSVFNFMKSLVGLPTETPSSTTTRVPRPTSRPQVVRTLSWVSQANQEFIRQMDESDVEEDEERLATSAERTAVIDTANVLNQTHNQYGNATGRSSPEECVAYLKGSPKILGWRVDERQEEAAWRTLMTDAMEGSIFERVPEGQPPAEDAEAPEPTVPQTVPQSKRDLYKLWLHHWDDENIDLIWKISVSLYGHHRWELVPVITGSALGTSALSETESGPLYTTEDIGVDTSDLFYTTHAETPIQTDEIIIPVKEYGEIAVQHEVDYNDIAVQSEKVGYDDMAVQSEKAVYGEIAVQSEPVLPPLDSTLNSPNPVDGQDHLNPWAETIVEESEQAVPADNVSISSEHKDKENRSLRSKLPRLSSIASLRHKSSKISMKNDSSESVKLDSPVSQGENLITASPRSSLSRSNSKDSLKSTGKTKTGTIATAGRTLKNSPSLRSIALEHNALSKKQRSGSTTSLATATTTTKVAESPTITTEVPQAKTAPVTPVEEVPAETGASRWWKLARSNTAALGGWRASR